MSKTKIPSQVLDALKFIDTIPNINCGGCGIVAYAILKRLLNSGSIKMEDDWAICFIHDGYNLKRNKVALQEGNNKVPGSCYHVVVRVKDIYLDSEGIYKELSDVARYRDVIETKSLTKLLLSLNHASWNCSFDREEDLGMIEHYLDVDLEEINYTWEELDHV